MNPLSLAALRFQNRIASSIRRERLRVHAEQSAAPVFVSFYHRVADDHPNDWTISRGDFLRQIDHCQANFELIGLPEVQRRISEVDSSTLALSLTFDDGYSDNCEFALPLLIERGIPCTYFVTTSNVLNQIPFPHDQRSGQKLAINTPRQIRELAEAGVEIGCHTRTHVDFSQVHDRATVQDEIFQAKDELEQMIGRSVRYIAIPYGLPQQLTQMVIESIHEAGFDGFCSAFGAYNHVGRDAFHIRRFHGDPEFARLVNWLSYDPRKVRNEPEVRYFLPPGRSFETVLCRNDVFADTQTAF